MFSIATFDYECTKKCKNLVHGRRIVDAMTKRGPSNEDLAAFVAKTCKNFVDIVDEEGRSALHFAVSVGNRYEIVDWLLRLGANPNLRDRESGHSALTRAIYYGNVAEAVLCQMRGATLSPDNDFINPLQYACRVKKPIDNENRCETFVWGRNKNYNLGIGNVQEKEVPEYLEFFRKTRIYVQQVSMNSYHSLFLSDEGDVFATGHGKGGRLGTGDEMTLVTPKKISIPIREDNEKIVQVSAGRNHSIVLSNKNRVYVTGSNEFSQLGLKSAPEMLLSFTEVSTPFSKIQKVIATDYTSLAIAQHEIYAFGANLGQLAMRKEVEKLYFPRKLPFNQEKHQIEIAEATNSALICYTENLKSSLLYLLYKNEAKVYKKPLMERLDAISVSGGVLPDRFKGSSKPLRFIVLTELRNIFVWSETNEKFVRCVVDASRFLEIDKIIWCNEDVLVSFFGHLYHGSMQEIKFKATVSTSSGEFQETYEKKELSALQRMKLKLKRIPYTDKVVDFCCDPQGDNFVMLLENPRKYFSLPDLLEKNYDFSNLYDEVNEFDSVHDLILEIAGRRFAAHKIIIFARCEYLRKIIQSETEKRVVLRELQELGLSAELFELILRFLYTNKPIVKQEIERLTVDYSLTLTMLKKVLTIMELPELITSLKKNSEKCAKPFDPLQRSEHTELFDVTIKLDGNREIRAHKCVLMSRLEYFNMMFMHTWTETDTVTLNTISIDHMLPIIEFLYSNNIEEVRNGKYSDNYLYNMITICDQFFVSDLKLIFELIASEKLSVRSCGEILEFAHTYNCETLQNCCMQYISLNLARILEHRSLENIDPDALQPISKFYRQFFGLEAYRTITPYSSAVTDEELMDFVRDFSVDLKQNEQDEGGKVRQTKVFRSLKPSRASLEKRNYEKEGISLIKDMTLDDERMKTDSKKLELEREAAEVSEKLESEAKAWLKVNDKKDVTKKKSLLAGLKANEVLKAESKPAFEFVPLKNGPPLPSKSPTPPLDDPTSERKGNSFSLGDFAVVKRSQKNRKRTTSSTWDQIQSPPTPSNPVASPPPNAWNIPPPVQPLRSPFDESPLARKPTARAGSSRSISFESPPAKAPATNSFEFIVESERKQKQYMEKIKTKSLVLTQLEETAIEELHAFYNVAETFDETITIERKRYCEGVKFTGSWYN